MNSICELIRRWEQFLQWIRPQIEEEVRGNPIQVHDAYLDYLSELVRSGKMKLQDAEQLRLINAFSTAGHASTLVLNQRINRAHLDYLSAKFMSAVAGLQSTIKQVDEDGLKGAILKEQADKLKEIFAPEAS